MRIRNYASIPGDGWSFRGAFGAPPTLRIGSTGQAVRDLQEMLNAVGHNVPVTGMFDAVSTALSVEAFQQRYGLKPDGIVGPLTWAKLNPSYQGPAGSVTATAGSVVIEKVVPGNSLFANVGSFFSDPINVVVAGAALFGVGWMLFGRK